jgi:hypothetical protein
MKTISFLTIIVLASLKVHAGDSESTPNHPPQPAYTSPTLNNRANTNSMPVITNLPPMTNWPTTNLPAMTNPPAPLPPTGLTAIQ